MKNKAKMDSQVLPDGVRELPMWVRRYAANRTLPVLVNMGMFLLAALVIAGGSSLANRELRAGREVSAAAFGTAALAASAIWVWLVASRRLGRLGGALSARLYSAEGSVLAKPLMSSRADRWVVLAFALCVAFSVPAGFVFEAVYRHMVPILAGFSVPFLLYVWARQGGMAAPFMLLWPGLWAAHAALAVAGVRPFAVEPSAAGVLLPAVGYGAVAALASHIYGRFALRKLRSLARSPEAGDAKGGSNA